MSGVLVITDGTDRVDLLLDFKLVNWTPQTAQAKSGGVWRDSPFLQGRQMVLHEYENIIDTFELVAKGEGDQDVLIYQTQKLRRLLEKAIAYWVTDWQNDPVWIETRGLCETETRYAVIHDYRTPNDDNPFDDPYAGYASFEDWTLILEHGVWLENEPGTTTDIEIGASETYDSRNLGNVDSAGTFTPTSDYEVFIANKNNMANITDIYYWDNSGGAWSANLMDAALPFAFMPPAPLQVDDLVIFGIDTSIADSGPFCSLVFDIQTAIGVGGGITTEWIYSDSGSGVDPTAWAVLLPQDNTNTDGAIGLPGDAFDTTGVKSVHWEHPALWTTRNPQVGAGPAVGVTGYWVGVRITAAAGAPTPPTQQNRDIYSITWPYTDIDSDQLPGDISCLIDQLFSNFSTGSPNYLYTTRVFAGARSLSRGDDFSAYINIADEQNHADITITAGSGAFANYIDSPTGRVISYANGGAILSDVNAFYLTIDDPLASEYTGTYRMFLRVQYSGSGAEWNAYATIGQVDYRDVLFTTPTSAIAQWRGYWELLDLGQVTLMGDVIRFSMAVYLNSLTAIASTIYISDIILIPVDECAVDASTFEQSTSISDITKRIGYAIVAGSATRTYLKTFSASLFKRPIRSSLFQTSTDTRIVDYRTLSNGKYQINANTDMRLWYLLDVPLAPDHPVSDFAQCYYPVAGKLLLSRNGQYLGMRGAR